jgi:hypothetical protein
MHLLDIGLSIVAGLSQLGNAFMGWKVTGKDLTKRQQKIYDGLFICVGLIGLVAIGILADRSGRQERAHFSTKIENAYSAFDQSQGGALIAFSWFMVDKPLAFNVRIKNVGNGSAYNLERHFRSFIGPDISVGSQREAVSKFQAWLPVQPHNSTSWAKDYEVFDTAWGEIMSPEDYSNVTTNNRRTVFVIGKVTFDDDFGPHEFDVCRVLQPQDSVPISASPSPHIIAQETWGTCGILEGEK